MKILFVCQGNINRSQMAGAIFKSLVLDDQVSTAGVYTDDAGKLLSAVSAEPIAAMKDIGLDITTNVITQLTPEMVEGADTVILTGPLPRGPIPGYLKNSPKLVTWDVPDPGYGQISVVGARDMIVEKVKGLIL